MTIQSSHCHYLGRKARQSLTQIPLELLWETLLAGRSQGGTEGVNHRSALMKQVLMAKMIYGKKGKIQFVCDCPDIFTKMPQFKIPFHVLLISFNVIFIRCLQQKLNAVMQH